MGITNLSSERHYMGSAASGRYSTDRDRRPDYNRLPDAATVARRAASRPAWLTRYLRGQNVVTLVLECQRAKAVERMAATELAAARKRNEGGGRTGKAAARSLTAARQTYERARDSRRSLSRQLRLLGISPLAESQIAQAASERTGGGAALA